jgi:hypothetical protein
VARERHRRLDAAILAGAARAAMAFIVAPAARALIG